MESKLSIVELFDFGSHCANWTSHFLVPSLFGLGNSVGNGLKMFLSYHRQSMFSSRWLEPLRIQEIHSEQQISK